MKEGEREIKEILVVEDEEIIRQGLKVLLEKVIGGFTVTEAKSGEEALSMFYQSLPHLVITDIRMGGMDGLTFISKVRQVSAEVPIIILSGHSDFEYARTAMRYGIQHYLLKPINRVELSETITKLFKAETKQDTSRLFDKILQYIDDYLSHEISLKNIADHVFLNPQYVGQLFKSELNQTFTEYITEQRLKRAKKLLKETNLKVYEVAQLSGYKSPKHFMTVFKHEVGMTPVQYREFS
ncbi:AraC family two component transcriptional regulator [Bacillus oleivorans]|uniref:AraC family two component transcriptional regulator n=1 Tax=Bacillus oleivorans TaxID=1448271 RepID=A0A285D6N9_9BACI|nr:response regulator [Bacillus oleivorans]SNX75481.1 AraC family two component transcriptional regulator [Bacillus oleivorans]